MAKQYEQALRAFGDECEVFATQLNEEFATPESLEDGEERGLFYWSEQDTAWQHSGDKQWSEFLGSVCWEEGRWRADWQEHA